MVVAATGVRPGPVRVNVVAFTVSGSIRNPEPTVKVALTVALGQTPTAAAIGLTVVTVMFAAGTGAAVVKVHT